MLSFIERIPEYAYVFSFTQDGVLLYGSNAYQARLSECVATWGIAQAQLYCTDLILWRELFHFLGSLAVFFILYVIEARYGLRALLVTALALFSYLLFQELYLHPLYEEQILAKGIFDIVTWSLVPATFVMFKLATRSTTQGA